jgi:hypothetical protein
MEREIIPRWDAVRGEPYQSRADGDPHYVIGSSPYDLHSAKASRFKAIGELLLLEDHIINDPCVDCMNKHGMMASRLMAEAATLAGGMEDDLRLGQAVESIRRILNDSPAARSLQAARIKVASMTRDVRKTIQRGLNLS